MLARVRLAHARLQCAMLTISAIIQSLVYTFNASQRIARYHNITQRYYVYFLYHQC